MNASTLNPDPKSNRPSHFHLRFLVWTIYLCWQFFYVEQPSTSMQGSSHSIISNAVVPFGIDTRTPRSVDMKLPSLVLFTLETDRNNTFQGFVVPS